MIVFSHRFHLAFALVFGIYLCTYVKEMNLIYILIGSIFPDCDIKYAPMGKILPLWLITWNGKRVFKHRGLTHSLEFVIFSSIISIYWIGIGGAVSFLFGQLTHLYTDSWTPMGIKWLYFKWSR